MGSLLEPLHAIYGKSCVPFVRELLDRGERRIIAFFHRVRVRYVNEPELDRFDPDRLSFANVNTLQDWLRVRELLAQETTSQLNPAV